MATEEAPYAERSRAIRERIRGAFDRAAGEYSRLENRRVFFRELARSLVALVPSLEGRRVLDVGCGSGASLDALREAVGPMGATFGLDLSLGMLREAKRQLGDSAQVVLADGCRFDGLFRGSFDAVVYNAVLFLLPDAPASLESAARVLSPGGVVLISSLEGLYLGADRRPVAQALSEGGHTPGRHAVSPWASVAETLERLFPSPVVEQRAVPMSAKEFLAFYSLERMSAGLLPALPYTERRQVLEKLSRDWECRGQGLEQVWTLAAARRPSGGET